MESALLSAVVEFVKVYGPLSLGWVVAFLLGKFILARYDADIQSRVALATSLDKLAASIEGRREVFERLEDVLRSVAKDPR